MCGIRVSKTPYNGEMQHRGIKTYNFVIGKNHLTHEHLPIQSLLSDNPVIETKNHFVLFNGELFVEGYDNDLDYLRDLFTKYQAYEAIEEIFKQDGFYSIIVYHKNLDLIQCFTDPLGKKQLYYSKDTIASEIRAIDETSIDRLFLSRTIKNGYVTDDSTPYMNIKRIMPNCLYSFNKNFDLINVETQMFKFFPVLGGTEDLYSLIDQSVKNRLKGHENVGLLLSGGLDSSIIHHHAKDFISSNYCVDNLDDFKYAKLLDKDLKLINFDTTGDEALHHMEMPVDLGSMYQQLALFKNVEERVILTGDGADELFGGYKRIFTYDSQLSDVFDELPFYHNIRLDRMSMANTIEARSPFMSLPVVQFALGLPHIDRINKQFLRDTYKDVLHDAIVNRPKEPLKSTDIRETDPIKYRSKLVKKWLKLNGILT